MGGGGGGVGGLAYLQGLMGGGQMLGGGGYDDDDEMDYDSEDDYGYFQPQPQRKPGQPPVAAPYENKKDVAEDKLFTVALKSLTQLLPRPNADDAGVFDYLPHETLGALLSTSTLGDLLSNFLRNDSTSDWTRRSHVYSASIDVISLLAGSEATLPFVFGDQSRPDKAFVEGDGVVSWLQGDGTITWERKAVQVVKKGRKRKADTPEPEGELVFAAP